MCHTLKSAFGKKTFHVLIMWQRGSLLRLGLQGKLPLDTIEVIQCFDKMHLAAIQIQRISRGRLCRLRRAHLRHALWGVLERELEACSPGILPLLSSYPGVRREWKVDPASWLHTLRQGNAIDVMEMILSECHSGYWQ